MRYRIVKYRNGKFGIQHRLFFIWFNEEAYGEEFPVIITYPTYEEALEELNKKANDEFEVIKIFEVSNEDL